MTKEAVQIRLPEEMHTHLKLRAALTGRSMAHEIRRMIEVFMTKDNLGAIRLSEDAGSIQVRSAATGEIFSTHRVTTGAEIRIAEARKINPALTMLVEPA